MITKKRGPAVRHSMAAIKQRRWRRVVLAVQQDVLQNPGFDGVATVAVPMAAERVEDRDGVPTQ